MPSVVFGLQAHGDSLGNPTGLTRILNPLRPPHILGRQPAPLIANDLAKDLIEADGDGPVWIVGAEFGEI
jgi:hypothetical protein